MERDSTLSINDNDLSSMGFGYNQPFRLVLSDNSILYCDQIIRLVPGRRLVTFATWNNQAVVAKLLFSRRALEQFKREVRGVEGLARNNIPTPVLHFHGTSRDSQIYVLIFERIVNSQSMEEALSLNSNPSQHFSLIQNLVTELATQHALGLWQRDLHLKNFLLSSTHIYTLDGADIEVTSHPLEREVSIDNLALLLSQFSITMDNELLILFQHYTQLRGWISKEADMKALNKAITHWRKQRWSRYRKKIFRYCSQFAKFKGRHLIGMVERSYQAPEFIDFLHHPDAIFSHKDTVILKAGRSSTVAKVNVDGRSLVVKRYNLKGWGHRLRRCLRTTRARRSWYLAQKLDFFGIPTAKTIAFVEQRFLGFKGKSYLVMEEVAGERGDEFFSPSHVMSTEAAIVIERVLLLIVSMAKLKMTHGDMKITNVFINQYLSPILIDLDGMQEHQYLFFLRRALHKEVQRFMDNFRDQQKVKPIFAKIFCLES